MNMIPDDPHSEPVTSINHPAELDQAATVLLQLLQRNAGRPATDEHRAAIVALLASVVALLTAPGSGAVQAPADPGAVVLAGYHVANLRVTLAVALDRRLDAEPRKLAAIELAGYLGHALETAELAR